MKGVMASVVRIAVNMPTEVLKTKKETSTHMVEITPPITNIHAGCLKAVLIEISLSRTIPNELQ